MKYGARDREETRLQVRKQDTKLEKFLARILRKYALSSLHIMGSFLEKLTFFRGFFSQNYCVTTLFQTTVTNFQLVRDLFYFLQLFIVVHTYVKYINKRADLIHRFLETPIFFFAKKLQELPLPSYVSASKFSPSKLNFTGRMVSLCATCLCSLFSENSHLIMQMRKSCDISVSTDS